MKKLRVGIIGSGFGLYGLLPAFTSLENCQVISICGKKTDRLLSYCQKIGLKKIYSDWRLMLNREKLDALAIAVTPRAQYFIAQAAIKRGLHIFAEKPLAVDPLLAKTLYDSATKAKIVHAVDFIYPEIDEWRRVKQLIDSKRYGSLKYLAVNWDFLSHDIKNKISSWKTDLKQGGGALSFYFSHSLYYLEHFAGKIIEVKSLFSYSKDSLNGGEVGVDLLFKINNSVNGYAHLRCDSSGLTRHQLLFQCEKATILLENANSITKNFTIKIYKEGKIKELMLPKDTKHPQFEDERVREVRKLAAKFADACSKKKQMTPSMKDGLRVQELIEKIRQAAN